MADSNSFDYSSTLKSIVTAINSWRQSFLYLSGSDKSDLLSGGVSGQSFVVVKGSGRLVSISVLEAGTGSFGFADAASIATANGKDIASVSATTEGITPIGIPFGIGLIINVPTGAFCVVVYSLDESTGGNG